MLYGPWPSYPNIIALKRLNPYFFGKCSTAASNELVGRVRDSLNPYFFGKCSTATSYDKNKSICSGLNPYFFGKCSTAGKY